MPHQKHTFYLSLSSKGASTPFASKEGKRTEELQCLRSSVTVEAFGVSRGYVAGLGRTRLALKPHDDVTALEPL